MKQKRKTEWLLLLHWAGEQKIWLFLAIFSIGGQWSLHYRPLHWDLQADGCHI